TMGRRLPTSQRPNNSQHTEEEYSESDELTLTYDPMAPLTIGILRGMLHKATADIKSHVVVEINKQL
ncbi:Hypothetical predicted protein, partial [Pelobates cultripes]